MSGSIYKSSKAAERKLTLEDVQGMFLLLGAGFGIASFVLTWEIISWLCKYIRAKYCNTGTNNEESITNSKEATGNCDFAHDSQQRIFLNEISLQRRVESGFEIANSSFIFKTPRRRRQYALNDSQCRDMPQMYSSANPDDTEFMGRVNANTHINTEGFRNRNYLPEDDCFGDLIHENTENVHDAEDILYDYDTKSVQYLSTKENPESSRSFTF